MSRVFQTIDPPPPSPPGECVLPPQQWRGVHTRGAEGGGWGSIFWKTRDIGLASYSNNLSTPPTLPPHLIWSAGYPSEPVPWSWNYAATGSGAQIAPAEYWPQLMHQLIGLLVVSGPVPCVGEIPQIIINTREREQFLSQSISILFPSSLFLSILGLSLPLIFLLPNSFYLSPSS
jgi:hypothetical protein